MNVHLKRKCLDPVQPSYLYSSDSERLEVRRRRDMFLRTYIEYKYGHPISLGKWTRRRRVSAFPNLMKKEPSTNTLSPKNLELISFLDSLLNQEVQEDNGVWERLERTIDENRLSDRKFFT